MLYTVLSCQWAIYTHSLVCWARRCVPQTLMLCFRDNATLIHTTMVKVNVPFCQLRACCWIIDGHHVSVRTTPGWMPGYLHFQFSAGLGLLLYESECVIQRRQWHMGVGWYSQSTVKSLSITNWLTFWIFSNYAWRGCLCGSLVWDQWENQLRWPSPSNHSCPPLEITHFDEC